MVTTNNVDISQYERASFLSQVFNIFVVIVASVVSDMNRHKPSQYLWLPIKTLGILDGKQRPATTQVI